ncbi:MAG: hypothetical protein KDA42_18210 [Planctomycetales bacterium]|nr:hypothetical protein [Planctomycetales bacterium]
MTNQNVKRTACFEHRRRGAALLLCLFVIAALSLVIVRMLDDQTSQLAATRNSADYERALYLAGGAVHHALSELEADFNYRGTITDGSYPGDDTYQAVVADGADAGTVQITGYGVAGEVTRKLQVTVEQGS